jgi:hypothetical protein
VGYLGLDPRVRQSADKAARHGHISRAGQAHARGLLVEAAHAAIRTPGPLRAFHARTCRAPRQADRAVRDRSQARRVGLASADQGRGLPLPAPTITQRKLRALQRKAGDSAPKISLAGETKRKVLERRFLEEAERNHQTTSHRRLERARVPPTGTRL